MPDKLFVQPVGEVHTLVAADGQRMTFDTGDAEVQLLTYGGYGAPPTQYITRQGYRQDGETEIYYQLGSRQIAVELHRAPPNLDDRKYYWRNRNDFHELLRPNRGPLTLTLITPGNVKRSIVCRADPGLTFPPPPTTENNWDIDETLNLIAFDPIWFDPAQASVSVNGGQDINLVFPITFDATHIVFGVAQTVFNTTIQYAGTWKSYPALTLTGPFTSAIITNTTTNTAIYIYANVLAGDKRVITLTPGALSIVDASGNNKFSDLGATSNLVDWNLRPSGEVTNGTNVIQCLMANATLGTSKFSMTYYNRYFAL